MKAIIKKETLLEYINRTHEIKDKMQKDLAKICNIWLKSDPPKGWKGKNEKCKASLTIILN